MAERMLRFRTAAEIARETPVEPEWIAKPWVAAHAVTAVDGKPKVSGKTTWVSRLIGCVLDGIPFMGEPTHKTPVVYLTEEGPATFRQALARAALLRREDLHVLYRSETWGFAWEEIINAAIEKCLEVRAQLLVVDTVFPFANLGGDRENNAGDMQRAFKSLELARDHGLAVVAIRHERKSGGNPGESARGSNAFTASADVIISLRRPEGHADPTIRELRALSRFSETPDTVTIDLTGDGYRVLSGESAVASAEKVVLKTLPRSEEQALSLDALKDVTTLGRSTLQKALDNLLAADRFHRTGKGVKGAPWSYWSPNHSATTPTPIGAESITCAESGSQRTADTSRHARDGGGGASR